MLRKFLEFEQSCDEELRYENVCKKIRNEM